MPLTAAGLSENFARFPINLAAENLMRGQRYKKKSYFGCLLLKKVLNLQSLESTHHNDMYKQ